MKEKTCPKCERLIALASSFRQKLRLQRGINNGWARRAMSAETELAAMAAERDKYRRMVSP